MITKGEAEDAQRMHKIVAERASAECEELSQKEIESICTTPPAARGNMCGSCKHEYEEKKHPLDEIFLEIKDAILTIYARNPYDYETLINKVESLRYESIKYGEKSMMEDDLYDDECFNADLKRDGHEDWIV